MCIFCADCAPVVQIRIMKVLNVCSYASGNGMLCAVRNSGRSGGCVVT